MPVAANHADFYQTTENNVFTSSSLSYAVFSSFSRKIGFCLFRAFYAVFGLIAPRKGNFACFFHQSRLVYLIFLKPMFLLSSCYITLLSASYHQKHVSDAAPKTAFLPFCTLITLFLTNVKAFFGLSAVVMLCLELSRSKNLFCGLFPANPDYSTFISLKKTFLLFSC